jgi:serine/threonine protein kinase
MTPEFWKQLESVFQRAAGMSSELQADYVSRIASENPALGRQLKELLEADVVPGPLDALNSPRQTLINVCASYVEGDYLLGRFKIVRLLGSGGMGSVYEAEDSQLGDIALKTIASELTADRRILEQLRKEVQLARRISHPNVCRIHELFVSDDASLKGHHAFVTMELLDGVTLSTEIPGPKLARS